MDLRGQDHKRIVMPSSFVYNSPIREPTNKASSIFSTAASAGGGRRDGASGNGSGLLTPSQAFDHHTSHHHHHLLHLQQSPPTQTPQPQTQTQTPTPIPPQPPQQQQQVAPTQPPQPQPQPQPQRVPDPEQEQESEPDPDPIPVSIAVAGIQIGGGSTPRTPRIEVPTIRYRECLKNHAASIGGHVVDGCGEFMPGGEEGTAEALKCAACECHRNFHRKESEGEPQSGANYYYCYNPSSKANGSRSRILPPSLPPPPLPQPIQQHQKYPIGLATSPPSGQMPPVMMAFGGGGGGSAATDSSSEEHNAYQTGGGSTPYPPQYGSLSKKRFRTKFSKEQKDKMLEFADKVGWRMQKQDEPAVQQFCAEVGVKRQVLKVWMHNNKHSMKKKDL